MNKNLIEEPKTCSDVLEIIDVFLNKNNDESKTLWAVLTALRGPDNNEQGLLKDTTTAVIRTKAFPKTAIRYLNGESTTFGAIFAPKKRKFHPSLKINSFDHFLAHAKAAAKALNLIK